MTDHDVQDDSSAEASDVTSFELSAAEALSHHLDWFLSRQRASLSYAEHLTERQEEFDGIRVRGTRHLKDTHPEFDDELINKGIELLTHMGDVAEEDIGDRFKELFEDLIESIGDDDTARNFLLDVAKAGWQPPALPTVLEATLTSLVADLEVLVSDLVKAQLHHNPKILGGNDRKFTWKEVVASESIEQFTDTVIERTVDNLMRESSDGWFRYLEGTLKVKLPKPARSVELREVIQRRHLLAHAGGRVSQAYLDNLQDLEDPPELGVRLSVDVAYLKHAADLIAATAFGLVANSVKALAPEDELHALESALVNVPYRCIQEKRYSLAASICNEFKDAKFVGDASDLIMKVNYWLAMKLDGRLDDCREEVRHWRVGSLSPEFQLAKLCLLSENEDALVLAKRLIKSEEIPRHHWLTWPLLAELRSYARVHATSEEQDELYLTTLLSGVVDSGSKNKENSR